MKNGFQLTHCNSLSHMSERSSSSTNIQGDEYDIGKKVRDLQKSMDEMQMSINEKEAEIIRLNLCLGDEKKKV